MKLYLIMLAISVISYIIVYAEIYLYVKSHYKVHAYSPSVRLLNRVKVLIMILLILPYAVVLLTDLFAHESFINAVEAKISEDERFEKRD